MLQLGNHEFHASLKKLFKKKKSGKSSPDSVSASGTHPYSNDDVATIHKLHDFKENKFFSFLRFILTHLVWKVIVTRNINYLIRMKEIIAANPHKKFIVLSPMPCLKKADRIIRSKGGKLYKKMFGTFENVTFIDLFNHIPTDSRYFKDSSHLNSNGHRLLAMAIYKESNYPLKPEKYPIAV